MSYIYSANGDELDKLTIMPGPDIRGVWVQINHGDTGWVTTIKPEDVPTVALALLETAEIGRTVSGWDSVDFAVSHLREHRDKQAALKSEDAKAREWWDETRYGHTTSVCWGHMGESARDDVRKQYKLARDFFKDQA